MFINSIFKACTSIICFAVASARLGSQISSLYSSDQHISVEGAWNSYSTILLMFRDDKPAHVRATITTPVAGPWSQGGLEVSIDSLHRDFASAPLTCTAEKHVKGDPQRAVGGRCAAPRGAWVKHHFGTPGSGFTQVQRTFRHRACFAGPEKQRDLSHVAAS